MDRQILIPLKKPGQIFDIAVSHLASGGWAVNEVSANFARFSRARRSGMYAGSEQRLELSVFGSAGGTVINLRIWESGGMIQDGDRKYLLKEGGNIERRIMNTLLSANFGWVLEGVLTGIKNPRKTGFGKEICDFLKSKKIEYIVCVDDKCTDETCRNRGTSYCDKSDFPVRRFREYPHIYVRDFSAPSEEAIEKFVSYVDEKSKLGAVGVHCGEGIGRTGTMLAIYLVHLGWTAGEAIEEVKRCRGEFVFVEEQEEAVREYERERRGK